MKSETLQDRLALVVGDNLSEFGRKCGIPSSTIRRYLDGSMPGADKAGLIAKAGAVRLDWLIHGTGPMRETSRNSAGSSAEDELVSDYVQVREVAASASAGPGLVPVEGEMDGAMGVSATWLRAMGFKPSSVAFVRVEGDSMELEDGSGIPDGAMTVVDTSIADEDVVTGKIYVLVRGDEVLVKRVERHLDGTITLHSDNPRYSSERIGKEMIDQFHIAGRVGFVGFRV